MTAAVRSCPMCGEPVAEQATSHCDACGETLTTRSEDTHRTSNNVRWWIWAQLVIPVVFLLFLYGDRGLLLWASGLSGLAALLYLAYPVM